MKNTCDHHGVPFDPYFARSVAKRAAGTLSAELPAVLAAKPSEKLGVSHRIEGGQAARKAHLVTPSGRAQVGQSYKDGAILSELRIAPLRSIEKAIAKKMRVIKRAGNPELEQAMIDILRDISRLKGE